MKKKIDLELVLKSKGRSDSDTKLLEIIKNNQDNKIKEIESSNTKVIEKMNKVKEMIKDKSNKDKMEAEKTEQNNSYLENNKKMKELFIEQESLENEVKDLLKKKSKLNNSVSSKEIEEDITKANRKTIISNLKSDYKKAQQEVFDVLKNNKEVCLTIFIMF